jgi:hypothetical protein
MISADLIADRSNAPKKHDSSTFLRRRRSVEENGSKRWGVKSVSPVDFLFRGVSFQKKDFLD